MMIASLLLAAAQLFAPPAKPAPRVDCRFDHISLTFAGTPKEQARCLLRHVEPGGAALPEAELPPTLDRLIGERPHIDFVKLAAALRSARIPLPAASPVSETSDHRRAAYFVDKILHGTPPGELPVEFPTKMMLSINLKAAKTLGIGVPAALLDLLRRPARTARYG